MGKSIEVKKWKYHIGSFKILNTYEINLIATWTSPYKSSLLFISDISKADTAKSNKVSVQAVSLKIFLRYHIVKEISIL